MSAHLKLKRLLVWGVAPLLCVATLAAAESDLRLVEAVKNKDRETAHALLKQKIDVKAAQADGTTALHWAAHWDDLGTADLLIRAGANVNAANDYGVTPLELACTNENATMVEKLLKADADPNASLWTGETALMTCSRTGNPDAVKAMLAHKANVNAKETRRGQTALMWAAAEKHSEAVRLLIDRGADVNAKSHALAGYQPLMHISYDLPEHITNKPDRFDNTGVHADPVEPKGDFTPLMFAARAGDLDSAKLLVAAGAKVNDTSVDGMTPLLIASASGYETLALFLLDQGANPNAVDGFGLSALHYAVQEGLRAMSCEKTIPTDSAWVHPNMPGLVKALLSRGANVNARISKGFPTFDYPPYSRACGIYMPQLALAGATPFLLASASGDASVMRVLLEGHADALLMTQEGTTPLMVAAGLGRANDRTGQEENGALEAVKLLVERGADVNAVAAFGRTALHGAAYIGADSIVQYLVDKGAKIDLKDKYGSTPLNIASGDPDRLTDRLDKRFRVANVHKTTAELLLKLGAAPLKLKSSDAAASGTTPANAAQ